MADALPPNATIGIIGGGQLGRMLASAAAQLGYRTVVLEPQADCPAAQVANEQIVAAYDDKTGLVRLCEVSDVITYEFENVPLTSAAFVETSRRLHPPAGALEVAQDRIAEKTFLQSAGVPTADFAAVDTLKDLQSALAQFDGRGVLKTRRFGYDGKGQHVFSGNPGDDVASVFQTLYTSANGAGLILEALVPFDSEFSIIAARSPSGEIRSYTPSANTHAEGILRRSVVPAVGLSEKQLEAAAHHADAVLSALDYVGVIGIEFFAVGQEVVANEIAPRVHNTGHWTAEACDCGQFEQHIRAIAGLPLGSTDLLATRWEMDNLLGAEIDHVPQLLATPGTTVTLYGKRDVKPGRKMGHVTRRVDM
ncbi:MAG: 5-(carboxyamino)imidazole ribonucleotide synthase [Pseudomonadota bacterium]